MKRGHWVCMAPGYHKVTSSHTAGSCSHAVPLICTGAPAAEGRGGPTDCCGAESASCGGLTSGR